MTRCCAQCTSNGGSHRSCGGGVKLFGVRLTDGSIVKKSASMGNLSYNSATTDSLEGYHSDVIDIADTGRRRPLRKKGVPWSKHEHAQFLIGLDKLGRGNWRGISRIYVPSRTSTQVASHAQKYFIRQSNANEPGKRKRPSLFDSAPEMERNPSQPELFTFPSPTVGTEIGNIMLSSSPAANMSTSQLSLDLSLGQGFTPLPFQLGPPNAYSLMDYGEGTSQNQMHRPEAVVPEEPTTELVGMSQLNLGETGRVQIESSPFSLRILGNP